MLGACTQRTTEGIGAGGAPKEKVVLSYPMWLSPQERATVDKACEALTAKFPTIEVQTEAQTDAGHRAAPPPGGHRAHDQERAAGVSAST